MTTPFGPLSSKVPPTTIAETNTQVKEVLTKKRGEYNKISATDEAIIGSMLANTV